MASFNVLGSRRRSWSTQTVLLFVYSAVVTCALVLVVAKNFETPEQIVAEEQLAAAGKLENAQLQDANNMAVPQVYVDATAEDAESFDNPDVFPEDIQESYNRYLQLIEALTYIEEHPNGGNINVIIKQSAKSAIEKEIATLNSNPLVIQFVQQQKRKNLEGEICAASKKLSALEIAIKGLKSEKERLEKVSSAMSQDEANQISSDLYNKIRQTNEKEQYTKLPQVIVAIKSEILLISQTIEDLQVRLKEIENQFPIS